MENKKILLPNKKYIGSPDSDIQIRVNLENKTKTSIEGSYGYTIDSNNQYTTERQDSNLFRPYLKISGMYYSNALNSPLIENYSKEYNTNYFINKQNTLNPNDPRNFTAIRTSNTSFVGLTTSQTIPINTIFKDSTPPGYDTVNYRFTANQTTIYTFGANLRLGLKNISVSSQTFRLKINFIKNDATTPETVYSQQIFNGNINGNSTITPTVTLVTSAITLNSSDTIKIEIEETSGNGSNIEYRLAALVGFTPYINSFYGVAKDVNSFANTLSNIDFLYDPIKTVSNAYNGPLYSNARSVIFSLTAPYDDIIITNISPLTNINSEQTVELLDYWYLPTDIKRDNSYETPNYSNPAGEPIIVSATTGWVNIGTFLTGTTEVDFSKSNVIRTNLFTFRGNMNVKIPKHQTYSFFVTVKNGNLMTNNELLRTGYGYHSVAGFMGLPETMASGDITPIKDYQQYCWLNIWPDSYELTASTYANVSLRDYYGWSNNYTSSPSSGNPYIFNHDSIITGDTQWAFRGVVNYKILQREPYTYRTQKLLSYNDYYDSVVPSKQYLEYINDNKENWELFSTYPFDKDDTINLYISESGITHTFRIGDGIPAKFNDNLTSFEISATTNTVFNSYFNHNLKIGDYVKVKQISGSTSNDLGVFPVISIGTTNNSVSEKLFTIKLTGFTGNYIQIKRYLDPTDSGSMSEYYIRKYKVIEDSSNYTISTPLSKNGFGNNYYYLTNTSEIDVNDLFDENNLPITSISYFFKKKNMVSTTTQKITKLKNTFYDEYYGGRNGFISRELLTNSTNFFISGSSTHNLIDYGLGLMASGLTNTYRNGSITPEGVIIDDDVFVFESDNDINLGTYLEFIDMYPTYSGLTALTQSIVYRKGDDFNYNTKKYFSLFSQYIKKPISGTSGDTFTLLGVKPTLNNFIGSKIAGSSLYPNYSMILINNQVNNFPIGSTIYFATGSTDTLTSAEIKNYELGGLYAVIDSPKYVGVPTTGATSLYTLQYFGDTFNVKLSDLMFDNYIVYYLGDSETKISIPDVININDTLYGDIVEYNQRELNTYTLQMPNYLFKLKDLYGYSGSTILSATTATYAKTDLLYPIQLKFFTNIIYNSSNVEDKKSWAVFNDNLNLWQWRDLIPNGDFDESGRGTDFPFLNGRHYIYNEIILPFRSKYWNPMTGNNRSLKYNPSYNFNNSTGTIQSINEVEDC